MNWLKKAALGIASGVAGIASGVAKAWTWLDGKKTTIGTIMLITADHLPKHTTLYAICSIGGQILGATGVLHKAKKSEKLSSGLSKFKGNLSSMKDNIKNYWQQSNQDPE